MRYIPLTLPCTDAWSIGRNALVNNVHLGRIGKASGLQQCCIARGGGPDEPSGYQLATTVEAVIAAVYLDSDCQIRTVEEVMNRLGLKYQSLDEPKRGSRKSGTPRGKSPGSTESGPEIKLGQTLVDRILRWTDW